ncbi:MAG: alpha-L-fucosidase [Planctomycetes bacterium]|nr:alpha-L-fucosidase [Planctomycetota bacterium]
MSKTVLSYDERIKWFHKAQFGMFVHFGLYSLTERGEWAMYNERIPAADYRELAAKFNPRKFDASAWTTLAKEAGAKYIVMTTRHHDGFSLWDSDANDFNSVKTTAGRDFVAEFVNASRKAGLKVGLYYSLLDWRCPGYFEPEKYPASARALVDRIHAEVRELMTRYGKIDILWYDGYWNPAEDIPMAKMARFWKARKLNAMVRSLQPHILINNRSGLAEDLDTPEQHVTASKHGRGWESCMTMGDRFGWGYIRNNPNMKTVPQLLQYLVTAAAGEGNYLLNIGPKPDGTVRREETDRLRAIGAWLKVNGEAVYGCERCELTSEMIGMWTRRGNTGYLNVFRWPGTEAVMPLVDTKPRSATLLATGERLKVKLEQNGRLVISGLPRRPPDPCVSVIKVRFDGKPRALKEKDLSKWLTGDAGKQPSAPCPTGRDSSQSPPAAGTGAFPQG